MAKIFHYDADGNPIVLISGGLPVYLLNGGGGGTASNFGVAFPASGTAAGVKDAVGNMGWMTLDGAGNLKTAGSVTVSPTVSSISTTPAQTAVGTTAGQVLATNAARKRVMLQNVGTTVIKITFGAVSPTQTAYHFALPAGGVANDGTSQAWRDEMWQGAIQAISSAAGGLLLVTELT